MEAKVLFVCIGNICRSPAAEGIMLRMVEKAGLSERITVDSAGTYSGHAGELPDPRMRAAALPRGYILTHRARPVRTNDLSEFDFILAMEDAVYERLHRMAPSIKAAGKIYRMTEFCSRHPHADHVPDPYYEGSEGFEVVLDLLEDGCEGLLRRIEEGPQ